MAADEQLRAQAARTIDRNVATFTFRLRLPKDQALLGNAVFGHREAQMAIDAEHRRVRMTSDRQLSAAATTAASVATGFLAQGKCRQCARDPALADTGAADQQQRLWQPLLQHQRRQEERRVGKGGGSTSRSRW